MSALHRPARLAAGLLLLAAGLSHADEALRPDRAKPLQRAQELMRAGQFQQALALVREADALGACLPQECDLLDRLRGIAAAGAGDDATAVRSFEAALASGRMPPAERLAAYEALANAAVRSKDFARATDWADRYLQDGGSSEAMRRLQIQARYQAGDHAGVVRILQARMSAPSAPPLDEPALRLLAASQLKLDDEAGYTGTLELLVARFPRKDYWADLIARTQNRPGFADRLALDVLRLQLATETLDDPAQWLDMARLALQAGLPAEASAVLARGFAGGRLGQGPDAPEHERLRDLAARQVREDERAPAPADAGARSADALVNTGQALVTAGRLDDGIRLLESGLAQPGLRRPDDARLHLAQAYLRQGDRVKAAETFRSVRGTDGIAELARLWALRAASP